MKKLLTIMAVLTVVATPALAQSYDPDLGTGNIAANPAAVGNQTAASAVHQDARNAFARVLPGATMSQSPNAAYDEQGNLVGTDPDANIRFQLHREAEQGEW
jgi:hypothetical protein